MSNLRLSDQKAKELIKILKRILKSSTIDFSKSPKGSIKINSINNREFILHYNMSVNIIGKYSIHLMDQVTKYTLVRLNVCDDSTFHKNANGERIYGTRVNIFSEDEYFAKGDGYTHYKAYSIPHEELSVHPSFSSTLDSFLEYTNTIEKHKIKVTDKVQVQLDLF